MQRKSKSVVPAAVLIALCIWSPGLSAQEAHDQSPSQPPKGRDLPVSAAQLPLEDLHDVGYILQLIRQQAVDIYAEATRLKTVSDANIAPLHAIPQQPRLSEDHYKPLRKAWIVFFIGTMEPLVHLLDEGVRDVGSGAVELKVPVNKRPELNEMMAKISDSLTAINKHLNKCADVLDTTDSDNLVIAQEAAEIVDEASKAEKARAETVKVFGNLGEPGTYEMRNKK